MAVFVAEGEEVASVNMVIFCLLADTSIYGWALRSYELSESIARQLSHSVPFFAQVVNVTKKGLDFVREILNPLS